MTSIIVHPFLFVIFRVLSLYAHNEGMIAFGDILKMSALLLGCVGVLWVAMCLLLRDRDKCGLLMTTLLFAYFLFAPLHDNLIAVGTALSRHTLAVLALTILGIPVIVIGSLIVRTKRDLRTATRCLNIFSVCALAMPMLQLGVQAVRDGGGIDSPETIAIGAQETFSGELPDIYYIVLDGYGRSDVLSALYGGDNSDFLDHLRGQGFYVAEASRANYCQTYLSIASSLNFSHLNELAAVQGRTSTNRRPLKNMIHNSAAAKFLKERGYRFVVFSSGYDATEIKNADVYIEPGVSVSEFEHIFSQVMPLPGVASKTKDGHARHRERIEYIFDALPKFPNSEAPKFVFTHFLTPHPPFIFEADGAPTRPNRRFGLWDGTTYMRYDTPENYRREYKAQIRYITARLQETLDAILAHSPQAIIVVQGDHGPGSGTDWSTLKRTDVWERMSVLNAYHFPGGGDVLLYPEITPVNTFRVIFNHYFGMSLEMLEDTSYYSIYKYPYRLQDVTERSKKPTKL